ncbi:MAG: DUF3617 domain-containing protein [Steroidobacteraceae bacterium]
MLALLPALAAANPPPPTRLQPGLWEFHYHSQVTMSGRSIPPMSLSAKRCITGSALAQLPLMPKPPGNIKCTAPRLTTSASGYSVRMSCTASEPDGMVSELDEHFLILPAASGKRIRFKGTVHQKVTGSPVPIPAALVHIDATGQRLGTCSAAKR